MGLWHALAWNVVPSTSEASGLISVSLRTVSDSVLRVYRIWHQLQHQVGVSGNLVACNIERTVNVSAGRSIPIEAVLTSTPPLSEDVTAHTGVLMPTVSILRRYVRAFEEIVVNATPDVPCWQFDVPLSVVWDAGYDGADVEPLTLRAGEGMQVCTTSGASDSVPNCLDVEFSEASS